MKRFKIGYFADGPWSHEAFELLIEDQSIEICFIVSRTDTTDLTLKSYSRQHKIDYFTKVKVNSEEFYNQVKAYECDLFVSMSFNQIFKNRIINLPRYSTINCHAGKLPFYRGRNILNWVLINDENEFGITVHFVDEGIDTGDIILQESYAISDSDNYKTLLEVAYESCSDLLFKAIKKLQHNNHTRIVQSTIHPIGFYCGKRGEGDEIINWNSTSRDLFNFIRAICEPGPMAKTFCNGVEVKIDRARLIKNSVPYKNTPGQILAKTELGFLVKSSDTFIEVYGIHSDVKLKVGNKLG